jgi:hypothetical protein
MTDIAYEQEIITTKNGVFLGFIDGLKIQLEDWI